MGKGIKVKSAVLCLLAGFMFNAVAAESVGAIIPIYKSNPPVEQLGFDVSADQHVALRFSPIDDVTLDSIELWFMNNSETSHGVVTLTLRNDVKHKDGHTKPGKEILESWTFEIESLGWNIAQEILDSEVRPELKHNRRYWLVAESPAPAKENPVWSFAQGEGGNINIGYGGSFDPRVDEWTSLGYSAMPNVQILGQLPVNRP